ncbi:MAG: capsid assembly protein [Bdellovibrionales bacterium]
MTNLLIENIDDLDPAIVPDKFKNPETGAIRLDALANSYTALEKKMSALNQNAAKMPPKSHDDYCINCDHGLFAPDADINKRLHAKGMTQEQVQEVYDLAAEKMVPMVKQVASDVEADRALDKLIEHFGGAEQWQEIAVQLLKFGQKNLPADVLENLTGSYEGVLALHRMMETGEPVLNKQTGKAASMDEMDLQSMMRDPKYWRDKDPAFVAKVTQGFEKMYGAK